MKILLKILKWTMISVIGIVGLLVLTFFTYDFFFYEREMNQIRDQLNEIENAEVINIWGHKDITLEEVSARLRIKDKGEIVLNGLSEAFNYPKSVPITEIGGYSFTRFSCYSGIGSGIDVGSESELGKLIGKKFYSVKDIIDNYERIINVVTSLKQSPELNHFENSNSENYLLVEKENSTDPLYNLVGIESKFEFARTLKWNRSLLQQRKGKTVANKKYSAFGR